MEILLIWLFFGLIGFYLGQRKGINPAMAFIGGILLGPLSFLMLFVSPEGKKCPKCAENIKLEAAACKHCGYVYPEAKSSQPNNEDPGLRKLIQKIESKESVKDSSTERKKIQ